MPRPVVAQARLLVGRAEIAAEGIGVPRQQVVQHHLRRVLGTATGVVQGETARWVRATRDEVVKESGSSSRAASRVQGRVPTKTEINAQLYSRSA